MKRRKNRKLTAGMVRVIVTCWIIPYIAVSSILFAVYNRYNQQQIGHTVCASMENAGLILAEKINAVIEMSRQASYDGLIKRSYEQYRKDGNESTMHQEVTDYLNQTYKYSETISNTILLYNDPVKMEYYTYSNVAGATYASIDEFRTRTAQAVRMVAKDLGTSTRLIDISGHLYVVRNIVRSNYDPFATLVMEVNKDRLFESTDNVIWKKSGIAALDGVVLRRTPEDLPGTVEENAAEGSEETVAPEAGEQLENALDTLAEALKSYMTFVKLPREGETAVWYDRKKMQALCALKVNGQVLFFANELDRTQLLGNHAVFLAVYIVAFLLLIPLLIATFSYLYKNINQPVGALMRGSEKIRKGEYGYRLEPFDKNEEMGQLVDTFNHMSGSLEDSFRRIYVEEIAERDATLKALQSQINPHFLNNTLEIINWKARLSGNEDVSEMIGALSVMMNATLNRSNEMFIPLSEEMSYVDAYLYIIRERFGKKFRFTKEIDEALLDVKIPRLIIQPIVENAVEHGGDEHGNIEGRLIAERRDGALVITVENNGVLSDEDRRKIDALLRDDHPGEREDLDRMSIGIRNVNLRLHLIYGGDSGLRIENDRAGHTVSTLQIRNEQSKNNAGQE